MEDHDEEPGSRVEDEHVEAYMEASAAQMAKSSARKANQQPEAQTQATTMDSHDEEPGSRVEDEHAKGYMEASAAAEMAKSTAGKQPEAQEQGMEVPATEVPDLQVTETDLTQPPDMDDLGTQVVSATEVTALQYPEANHTQQPAVGAEERGMEVPATEVPDFQIPETDITQPPADMHDLGTQVVPATEATALQHPEANHTQQPAVGAEERGMEVPATEVPDFQIPETDLTQPPADMDDLGTQVVPATEATALQQYPEANHTQQPAVGAEERGMEVPATEVPDFQIPETDITQPPADMHDLGTQVVPATEATALQHPEANHTQQPAVGAEERGMEVPATEVPDFQIPETDLTQPPADMDDLGTQVVPATEATALQQYPEANHTQQPAVGAEERGMEVPATEVPDFQIPETDLTQPPADMDDLGTQVVPATEATALQQYPEANHIQQPAVGDEERGMEVPATEVPDLQVPETADLTQPPDMDDLGTLVVPATEATALQQYPEANHTQQPVGAEERGMEVPATEVPDLQIPEEATASDNEEAATEVMAAELADLHNTVADNAEDVRTHHHNGGQGITDREKAGQESASGSAPAAGLSCQTASTVQVATVSAAAADNTVPTTCGRTMDDSRAPPSKGAGSDIKQGRHSLRLRQQGRVMTRAVARAMQVGNDGCQGQKRKLAAGSLGGNKSKEQKRQCTNVVEADEGVTTVEGDGDEDKYETIESTVYSVASFIDVPEALARHGLVLLKLDSLKNTVSEREVYMAVRFAQKYAVAIFQDIPRDENGNFIPELDDSGRETDVLVSDYGTGQRRQIILNSDHAEILANFRDVVERELDRVRMQMGGQTLRVNPPSLLINTQTARQQPVSRQCWHTDLSEGQTGYVAIAAVQKFSLLVFPGSHKEVQECWRLQDLVKRGVISEASFKACLGSHSFKAVRMNLELGDILFMSGHTIHAGDRGTDKHPGLRMHWYVTDDEKKNETSQIVLYGDDFAKRFH
ncbi:hypothetical protein Vretimale_16987 [Volvox reticuliferus]|nr:hypothetical protein Vretimale_16987 [Volvox reticuliferus]